MFYLLKVDLYIGNCFLKMATNLFFMKAKLFIENMWEFFYFVPYKVNIPMYAGGFK